MTRRTGEALLAFINGGGDYVGNNANGVSAARTISATTLNTVASTVTTGLLTPGSTFDGTYDSTNPVAWGFDLGGSIYRDSSGNPVFDTGTLGNGDVGRDLRATPDEKYGYESRASILAARPGGRGRAVRLRPQRPDRVRPVLPLLEGAGRAPRAQRGAVPEGRARSAAAPSPASAEPCADGRQVEAVAAPGRQGASCRRVAPRCAPVEGRP